MKSVAYSIKPFERDFLAKANQKKHDITLISNALSTETIVYAEGKEAVIVSTNDDVSALVIGKLADLGIKYIVTRSVSTDHIDKEAAAKHYIKLCSMPSYPPQAIAEYTVALAFALNRHLLKKADRQTHHFEFRNDDQIGFNFTGKTVGLIGLGAAGKAAARIFGGLGCRIIGYDRSFPKDQKNIQPETFPALLAQSDIISIHLPLNESTKHLINKEAIGKMKNGVMLINTSGGGIIKIADLPDALENGKIGYLGLDAFELEKGLPVENQKDDLVKHELLKGLMQHPNVLITPRQAFLTREALQEISNQTINSLDNWQMNKCEGDTCMCTKVCRNN
jgi:D-lactate dehydrogenase